MSYYEALEAAGARVIAYEAFGTYQGEWYAKVEYNGVTGYVSGSYGSCSGCDAFEAEFGWDFPRSETDPELREDYQERLVDFGKRYLDDLMTDADAVERASTYLVWDTEADEMVDWVLSMKDAT